MISCNKCPVFHGAANHILYTFFFYWLRFQYPERALKFEIQNILIYWQKAESSSTREATMFQYWWNCLWYSSRNELLYRSVLGAETNTERLLKYTSANIVCFYLFRICRGWILIGMKYFLVYGELSFPSEKSK